VSIARMVHAGSATDAVLNHGVDRRNDSGIQVDGSNEPRLVRGGVTDQAAPAIHTPDSIGPRRFNRVRLLASRLPNRAMTTKAKA
jgi:hypothetical protein